MISVICPTYNEADQIEKLIQFFINSEPKDKELILIDGGSVDGTIEIIKKHVAEIPNIKLFHNKNKYVPFALNLGIKNSLGDPIVRLDAHTEYFQDYFLKIIEAFETSGADIVGGPMIKKGETNFQKAVAFCTSSKFGIGDSKIHQIDYSGPSDHVYLGAWKRGLFDEIGYFDERLLRNQDDEFHYRAKSLGKQIFISSKIVSHYFPRTNLRSLFKQYFQYGLFKPAVLWKIKSEIKIRHLVPSAFILYLLLFLIFNTSVVAIIPLVLYISILLFVISRVKTNFIIKFFSAAIFPTLHISYGFGFLVGLISSFFSEPAHLLKKWF